MVKTIILYVYAFITISFPYLSIHSYSAYACQEGAGAIQENLYKKLKALPGVEVREITPIGYFKEAFEIRLTQPLDHRNPDAGTFAQRIFLSHADFEKPVLLETEGYGAFRNTIKELSRLLSANQIIVEHRFFGESKPDSMMWNYLTVKQAAADHHRIVELFKRFYKGKWINSGTSKGGQTALFHRRHYPDDVDVTFTYVAPINLALEDPRINRFLENVGDEECREKIKQFQIAALTNRKKLLPLMEKDASEKNSNFSIGIDVAFEYAVLEYSFSFWQYRLSDCSSIPGNDATAEELFKHLTRVVPLYLFTDAGMKQFESSYYQFYTELGYYEFMKSHVKDLLVAKTDHLNKMFTPQNAEVTFRPEVMRDIYEWLQKKGDNIIYIYGEDDTWSATAVELTGETNALKIVKKGGSHGTKIRNLPDEQKEAVLSTLERWLEVRIER